MLYGLCCLILGVVRFYDSGASGAWYPTQTALVSSWPGAPGIRCHRCWLSGASWRCQRLESGIAAAASSEEHPYFLRGRSNKAARSSFAARVFAIVPVFAGVRGRPQRRARELRAAHSPGQASSWTFCAWSQPCNNQRMWRVARRRDWYPRMDWNPNPYTARVA